jgi:hypothetical protein
MKIHAPDITGSLNTLVGGNISGSITSTGSFGHIMKGGVNWDTAVSTSAAAGGFGPTGQNTFTSVGISGSWQGQNFSTTQSFSDGTATKISGSATSTGSFGHVLVDGFKHTNEVLKGIGSTSVTAGKLYYLKDVGNLGTSTWQFACAASASSAVSSGSDELLAVAMGSGSYWDDATSQTGVASSIGMLTRGVTSITGSFFTGTTVIGGAVYMATASAKEGQYQFTTPSADGDRVRIVGNCISTGSKDITVRFNPSTTYLVLSGSS